MEVAAKFMATRPAPDGVGAGAAGAVEQLQSIFMKTKQQYSFN